LGGETPLNYFFHYIAPPIVSGIVVFACFYLGVKREKGKETKRQINETKKLKENVVLSLWELLYYNKQNEWSLGQLELKKTCCEKEFLFQYPLDCYEISKTHNFFDFDYELKENFLLLKMWITGTNRVISIYNDIYGQKDNISVLEELKSYQENIKKCCDNISALYKKIIVSRQLAIPMLEHVKELEEKENKLQEIKKVCYGG